MIQCIQNIVYISKPRITHNKKLIYVRIHIVWREFNMGLDNFSVRMDENDKAELKKLIDESELSNKDFMNELMSVYKLSKMKSEVPEIAEDIKHLEALITQIGEIYIGIGKRITTIEETKEMQYNNDINIYKEKISSLEREAEKYLEEKGNLENQIKMLFSEQEVSAQRFESLNNAVEDKTRIIEDKANIILEYKEKNDNLLGMLNDLKKYKEELDSLNEDLAAYKTKNLSLENDAEKIRNEIQYLQEKHEKEIASLKQKSEYEKERALLDQEKTFNTMINNLKDEFNNKTAAAQEKYNNQILKYQQEIESLIKGINVKNSTKNNAK